MSQRYLWYKVSHIPATTLLCWGLYVCFKFGITKFCASCSPYPCATSFSYCHILIFPLQLFPLSSFLSLLSVSSLFLFPLLRCIFRLSFLPFFVLPTYLSFVFFSFKSFASVYHFLPFPSNLNLYFLIFPLLFLHLLFPLVFVLRF